MKYRDFFSLVKYGFLFHLVDIDVVTVTSVIIIFSLS